MGDSLGPNAGWRYVGASAVGTSHLATHAPCQDAWLADVLDSTAGDGQVLVLAVADGAGSAPRAADGSKLACYSIVDRVRHFLAAGGRVSGITEHEMALWYDEAAQALEARAQALDVPVRELACTLLTAVIGESAACFGQLGDGAIVRQRLESDPDSADWLPVIWPQSGEYANTTFFLTDPVHRAQLAVVFVQDRVDEVALFSDGLQLLALNNETRGAHAPFFRGLFPRLRLEAPGESRPLTQKLEEYLDSRGVNARTDDDKTLVLATRAAMTQRPDADTSPAPPDPTPQHASSGTDH